VAVAAGAGQRGVAGAAAPAARAEYVVVGGGVAGAMAEFAANGVRDVALISAARVAPYERPALTKGFLAAESPARLPGFHTCVGVGGARQDPEWYSEHFDQGLHLNTAVIGVDHAAKTLTFDSGATFGYGKLLVATGTSSFKVASLGEETVYIRSVGDATALVDRVDALEQAGKGPARVAVIGGGLIGTEVAGMLSDRCDVTLLCREERLLEQAVPAAVSPLVGAALGCRVVLGASVDRVIEGGDAAYRVVCGDTEHHADVVVAGVGARPATGPFGDTLHTVGTGHIGVTEALETSQADVFAAGDVMAFPSLHSGREPRPLENVNNARASARFAVRRMLGIEPAATYDPVPHAYSRISNSRGSFSWERHGVAEGDPRYFQGSDAAVLAAVWADPADGTSRTACVFLTGGTPEQYGELKALVGSDEAATSTKLAQWGLEAL